MTATLILASKDVQAGRNAGYCPAPHDALGTTIQRNTPGQLWEREAERDAATELYARFMRCGGETGTVFLRTRAMRERARKAERDAVTRVNHPITWGLYSIDDE